MKKRRVRTEVSGSIVCLRCQRFLVLFFAGAVVILTAASESVTNRCLRFGGE
jgi:hypothetical protein